MNRQTELFIAEIEAKNIDWAKTFNDPLMLANYLAQNVYQIFPHNLNGMYKVFIEDCIENVDFEQVAIILLDDISSFLDGLSPELIAEIEAIQEVEEEEDICNDTTISIQLRNKKVLSN